MTVSAGMTITVTANTWSIGTACRCDEAWRAAATHAPGPDMREPRSFDAAGGIRLVGPWVMSSLDITGGRRRFCQRGAPRLIKARSRLQRQKPALLTSRTNDEASCMQSNRCSAIQRDEKVLNASA